MLGLQGVGHVVALHGAFEVIEKRAHVGAAFDIGDAQRRTALQDMRPACAGPNRLFPKDGRMIHNYTPSIGFYGLSLRTYTKTGDVAGLLERQRGRRTATNVHRSQAEKHANGDERPGGPLAERRHEAQYDTSFMGWG